MKYYSIHQMSNILGVSAQTLRNWDRSGKLKPHHTTQSGYRYYSEEQLNSVLHQPSRIEKTIGYCRVSSSRNKEELAVQINDMRTYLLAQGKPFEIISDTGSGLHYRRSGLEEMMEKIASRQINKVVVMTRDRLVDSFSFDLLEIFAELYGCTIEVIDTSDIANPINQQEAVENLTQILSVYADRLPGRKAQKIRKFIRELTDDDT